jgi:hypothetical protein
LTLNHKISFEIMIEFIKHFETRNNIGPKWFNKLLIMHTTSIILISFAQKLVSMLKAVSGAASCAMTCRVEDSKKKTHRPAID